MRPATIVGSAKGRSITALSERLAPEVVAHEHEGDGEAGDGVDMATMADAASVSSSAATASGWVMAAQNALHPPLKALERSAATGSRTSSDR